VRRGERLAAAAAFAAALVPFRPAASAGFLAWDDVPNLVDNSAYAGFTRESLAWMWSTHFRGPWQPLSWLSYALDRAAWGLDAPAFRRTNFFLHALAAALLVLVARRLLDAALGARVPERARNLGALAAGLLFALHPLRVESVVWITERRDVLSGALLLGAWLAYLEESFAASIALFVGALLSKGTAIALPFFLLAQEVYPYARLSADPRRWLEPAARPVQSRLAPFFALAACAALANAGGFSTGDLSVPDISWWGRLELAAHAPGFYLAKTVLPVGLSPYYPILAHWSALEPRLAAYAVLGAAATVALWAARRRAPWAWSAWLASLAALAPVSGLAQNGAQTAADRYSYLPCLPFALVAGGLAARAAASRPRAAALVVAALSCALGAAAWRQSGFWRDDAALWTRAVSLEPDGYLPRSNLASTLLAAGDDDGAFAQYAEVLRLHPDDFGARINVGFLYEKRGRLDEAESSFRAALALSPGAPDAGVDLAALLWRRGARREAAAVLEGVAARAPDFAPARFDLGVMLAALGKRERARAELKAALALDPSLAARLRGRAAP
jgi:tetratricopeptide (TPR) repeat protein